MDGKRATDGALLACTVWPLLAHTNAETHRQTVLHGRDRPKHTGCATVHPLGCCHVPRFNLSCWARVDGSLDCWFQARLKRTLLIMTRVHQVHVSIGLGNARHQCVVGTEPVLADGDLGHLRERLLTQRVTYKHNWPGLTTQLRVSEHPPWGNYNACSKSSCRRSKETRSASPAA